MAATRLGEILRDNGIISFLQLAEALQIQKEERGRIGDILVYLGYITKRQLRYVIREYKKRIPLGEYLVERGTITPEDLEFALKEKAKSRRPLGQILIELKIITEEDLAKVLAEQLDMPYIVPYQRLVDSRLFSRLPADFMRHNKILPLSKTDGMTTVLVPGMLDEATSLQLERVFGQDIELAISTPSKIEETINALLEQRAPTEIRDLPKDEEPAAVLDEVRMDLAVDTSRLPGVETRAIELLNFIISEAIKDGASDIHLEPMADRVVVRFRVNGLMTHKVDLPRDVRSAVVGRIKALAGLNVSDTHRDQEGRLMGRIDNLNVDLRVSVFVGVHGEAINLRLFRQETAVRDLHDLGMTPNAYSMCRRALDYASGLIVFAGPPASGKTTTMFAALNHLNERKLKIVTIEEPVEYVLHGAVQTQISDHRDATLSDVINAAVHQDPDVIAVGAIPRDEDAQVVLTSALTGHKMLTTLHADDTVGAMLRLTGAGLNTFLRSSTALTIVCQRLVRKICPYCQTTFTPEPRALAQFPVKDFDPDRYDFYQGRGCVDCQNTGYSGRTGIFEVLHVNDEVREAFVKGATSSEILAIARATSPFLTINEVGVLNVIRRITTVDEILRVAPMISRERELKNPLTLQEIERISESSGYGD